MSKIANAFKGGNGKAFIPFITCGDPSLEVTEQLVYAMEEAGANLMVAGSWVFKGDVAANVRHITEKIHNIKKELD